MATPFLYTKWLDSLANKKVDLHADALGALLLTAYTPDQDGHQFVADVLAAGTQVTGSPYSAGGLTLSTVTWTVTGGVWTLTAADPTWGAGAITANFVLWFDKQPGTDATNPVICYWDLGGAVTLNPFVVPIGSDGIFQLARA